MNSGKSKLESSKVKPANILVLLDVSGSMNPNWGSTCKCSEEFIKEQKNIFKDTKSSITVLTFNNNIKVLNKKENLKTFKLNIRDIVPSGYTSLYDAILESKQYLSSSTKNFIVIITDGEDTSSTKTKKECSDFIEKCKKELVEVIYLGINIDSTEATSLGIKNTFDSTFDNLGLKLTRGVSSLIRRKSVEPDYYRQVSVPITDSEKKNIEEKVTLQKIKRQRIKRPRLITRQNANPDCLSELSVSDIPEDMPTELPSF